MRIVVAAIFALSLVGGAHAQSASTSAGIDTGVSKDPWNTGGFNLDAAASGASGGGNSAMPSDVSSSMSDAVANNNFAVQTWSDLPGWGTAAPNLTLGAHN